MTQNGSKDLGEIARGAIEKYQAKREIESHVTLSNGIVLRLKPLSEEPIRRAVMAVEMPEVPTVKLDGLDAEEPNPDDPEYLEAVTQAQYARTQAGFRVATILGTECEKAPNGYGPGQKKWIDDLAAADVEVDTSSASKRYVEWLYMYALSNTIDRTLVGHSALMFSFVEVVELAQAIQFFWDRSTRDAAAGGDADGEADVDGGDVSGPAAGVDRGDGGTGDGGGGDDPVDVVEADAAAGEGQGAGVEAGA